MVLKFLGIGKKSGFFLEAPPADAQPTAKAKPATELAKPTAEIEADKLAAALEPSHLDAKAVLAPAVEQISKATSKVKKTLKEANAEKKAKTEKSGAEPKVPEVPAAKPEPTLTNFATTLQANNTPRRRPGPSLDVFKNMAKQVNSRK